MTILQATVVRPQDWAPPPGGFRAATAKGDVGIWEHDGSDGTRSMNTMQLLGRSQADTIPHRHTFEQIRYVASGRYSYGPGRNATAGDLMYFPESVFYGPQKYDESELFQLQWQGPSGIGKFYTYGALGEATQKLKAGGSVFDPERQGVCIRPDGRQQDGFEACAEELTGHQMEYAPPRYSTPTLIHGSRFPWVPLLGYSGVHIKHLAYFSEYGPNIKLLRLDPGATMKARTSSCETIMTLVSGSVRYGDNQLERHSQIYAPPDSQVDRLEAMERTEILVVNLAALDGRPMPFTDF